MTDEGMKKLKDLRKEYEFLAKCNGGEDYIAFKVLDMAINELSAPEESVREWCKQNGYVMMRESDYEQAITKAYFEGQNAEPCEDAISRQAVEKYVSEYGYKHGNNWIDNSILFKFLKSLPSVYPTEKVGKWIPGGLADDFGNRDYECSYCHYMDNHNDCKIVPYCWHCGAKMKGGAND